MQSTPSHPRPNINDTEKAFKHLSDKDLRWAIRLFKVFHFPILVSYGPKWASTLLRFRFPIKGLIRNTLFKHFCGGETIEGCNERVEQLAAHGVHTILDYSVEGEESEEAFDATCEEIIRTIEQAEGNPHIPFAVFKVTGVGKFEILKKVSSNESLSAEEDAAFKRIYARVERICRRGFDLSVSVLIDAEESWIQPAIDSLALDMSRRFNENHACVFNTLQLYRHDRLAFLVHNLEEYSNLYLGFKLVRGAYMEKERNRASLLRYTDPIQPNKAQCDADYNKAITLCLEHISRCSVVIGTHNGESCLHAVSEMERLHISPNNPSVYFSQLLGMSDPISFNFAWEGYCVAKYVPYGPIESVLPYLGRRAEENSSVKGQSSRELDLLISERKRRGS